MNLLAEAATTWPDVANNAIGAILLIAVVYFIHRFS